MNAREWKPGDVGMLKCSDGEERIAILTDRDDLLPLWIASGPEWGRLNEIDVRPVVVIDPEDRAQVERLIAAIETAVGGTATARARDNMQAALRSLIAAPKPVEPETWGVVEASCVHNRDRREWVKHPDGNWWPVVPYSEMDRSIAPLPDDWSDLVDPALIREGVTQ